MRIMRYSQCMKQLVIQIFTGVVLNEKKAISQKVVKRDDLIDTHEEKRKSLLAANHKRKHCNSSENAKSGDDRTANGNCKRKQLLEIYNHGSFLVKDYPALPSSCNIANAKGVTLQEKIMTGQNFGISPCKNVLTATWSSNVNIFFRVPAVFHGCQSGKY